ncbi:Heat shock factor protein [Phytophthora megakarya]|uniref:Heat shock factor protein n=1 Tax=Phytophthora megakarya TaxID=4795 RepID=A0A225VAZ3_9STRA|nr:Heat shock factor protein [Phytophthora megakarya]
MKETSSALAPSTPGNRRPRAQSMQHYSDKCSVPRECCSSGSFVSKLYRMVDTEPSTIVSWCRGGSAFCIVDPKMMAEHCLPKYFRHRRFSSLIRQLNFYSFYRVQEGQLTIYQHSFFRKGRPDLLVHIKRRGAGKAKDPWFDPLANTSSKAPEQTINLTPMSGAQTPTLAPTPLGLAACYSPMAKPVALDNMSPALKPAMVQACPPSVDLGGSYLSDGLIKKEMDHAYPLSSALNMKNELLYGDLMDSTLSLAKTSSGLAAPLDIDIQDFLTDDCNITPGQIDDRLCAGMNPNKCAMVSRDCLKFDDTQELEQSPLSNQEESETSFENEVLMDLAYVEPGAWEVPLSPLNDEEDMMPWLDLCF